MFVKRKGDSRCSERNSPLESPLNKGDGGILAKSGFGQCPTLR